MTTIHASKYLPDDIDEPQEVVPLFNNEAEMSALGAMLLSARAITEIRAVLKPEDFYRPAHRIIYDAICSFPDGQEVDFVMLRDRLGSKLADAGGIDYIVQVAEYVPSPAGCEYYAKIVKEKSVRRLLAEQGRLLNNLATNPNKTADEVAAFAHSLADVAGVRPAVFLALGLVEIGNASDQGVSTGFPSLDRAISTGGYPKKQMTVWRAYHKGGKTATMLASAIACAQAGLKVCYATFADLDAVQLKRRVMRNVTTYSRPPTWLGLEAVQDFDDALDDISLNWEFYVYDASALDSGDDVETFAAWLKAEHNRRKFDVVFVDYAQELRSSDRKATNEVSEQNICAHKIAQLARKTGLAIVVGSQITEGQDGQKVKTKYSRAWEEKAGWVLTLNREGVNVLVEVSYSRFGPQGEKFSLLWNEDRICPVDPHGKAA